jgi:hypothetical protein
LLNFNNDEIEKLISNKYELDCIDITMAQQVEEDPIVYSGSGTIYQDKNGVLNLKLYSKISDLKKELIQSFSHHTPGKILGNEHYFSLKAIDMSGEEWISENIWVSGHVSVPSATKVVKSELKEITHVSKIDARVKSEKSSLFIVIPGDIEIPCNRIEELPNGGAKRSKSVFSFNQTEIDLKKRDTYLAVNLTTDSNSYNEKICTNLLESLSIIFGRLVRRIYYF